MPLWKRVRPEEYLFCGFLLTLAFLIQFGTAGRLGWRGLGGLLTYHDGRVGLFSILLAAIVGIVIVIWGVLRASPTRMGGIVRDAVPFIFSIAGYVLLRDVIPFIRPDTVDARLAEMETNLFGTPLYVALPRALGCGFLDYFLMISYWSHFYLPPFFAIYLAHRNREAFSRYMLAVSIACAIGYLGYIAVPAIGPRYLAGGAVRQMGPGVAPLMDAVDSISGMTRDCFPSLHMAWTVVTLWAAWPMRRFFWCYVPVAAGLILATLYFGFHYFIDLPAGAFLALLSIVSSGWIRQLWSETPAIALAPRPLQEAPPQG